MKNLTLIALTFVLALLVGCATWFAPQKPEKLALFFARGDFDDRFRLGEAAGYINDTVGRDVIDPNGDADAPVKFYMVDDLGQAPGGGRILGVYRAGFPLLQERRIEVVGDLQPFETALVMTHEIVHAVGVGHSEDPDSIMYPVINLNNPYHQSLTEKDRQDILNALQSERAVSAESLGCYLIYR